MIALDTTKRCWYITERYGGVAKLVIALACHAGDRGFEPLRSRQISLLDKRDLFFSGISAAGSALRSGRRGRRFKSAIPDSISAVRYGAFFVPHRILVIKNLRNYPIDII